MILVISSPSSSTIGPFTAILFISVTQGYRITRRIVQKHDTTGYWAREREEYSRDRNEVEKPRRKEAPTTGVGNLAHRRVDWIEWDSMNEVRKAFELDHDEDLVNKYLAHALWRALPDKYIAPTTLIWSDPSKFTNQWMILAAHNHDGSACWLSGFT